MKPTQEQEAIIEAAKVMQSGAILKVDSGAGCAKSSTLVFVAQAIKVPSICLVFNKSAQEEAQLRFPPHVECRTTHSLAYGAVGYKYQHKLSRPQGRYINVLGTGSEIAKYFDIEKFEAEGMKDIPASFLGLVIRNTVNKFEQSADVKITKEHLPHDIKKLSDKQIKGTNKLKTDLVKYALKLWELRTNVESNTLCTHDTYLKLYQLSQPKLDFETIYVDECQDSNPCFLEILRNQTAKVIFVGDKYQAIYQWRGAVNALESIEGQVLNLSTSFRYGQDVADLACKVLDNQLTLTSFEGLSTEVGEDVIDKTKPYTILYRTNQKLVLDAVKAIQDGLSVNIEIDVRDFCNMLTSTVALYRNDMTKVKHEDLLSYNNFQELKDEAEGNGAFGRLVQIIESGQSYQVINALQYHKNSPKADITFTTAHKAKGREWNQVELADDFPRHIRNNEWIGLEPEEMNLLYVATTRARQKLNINKTLKELWYKDLMDKKDRGLQINIKQMTRFSAGASKYEIAAIIDKHVDQDHRLQAYEDFLNDDRNCDEYACDNFEGELNLLPDIRNMRFPI